MFKHSFTTRIDTMDDLSEEVKELTEKLAKSGLPDPSKILGRRYVCAVGIATLYGTITSVDDANDDGYIALSISSPRYRGDAIEAVWFCNGNTYLLYWWKDPGTKFCKKELRPCSFQLVE